MMETGDSQQDLKAGPTNVTLLPIDGMSHSSGHKIQATLTSPRCRKFLVVSIKRLCIILLAVAAVVGWYFGTKSKQGNYGLFAHPKPVGGLIHLRESDESIENYMTQLDEFLEAYKEEKQATDKFIKCHGLMTCSPFVDKVCRFPLKRAGKLCVKENTFGYNPSENQSPCLVLTLRLPQELRPIPFSENDTNFPVNLEEMLDIEPWTLPVTCQGNTQVDQDNMGEVIYKPMAGFPLYYFPYHGQENYLSPLVFIMFKGIKRSMAVTVTCSVWASNFREGSYQTTFSLLLD
ncbi:sodium/potassium-transporting ATPase subunit beta [Octopus bimaculoides]|uniref:sodium/potassium-transporting ATPase subunit beta n=1 Tax=Octopus bimaculoides TaxID=37653 RepID=UPI00071CE8C5|nr:sodium/potassium-transporting ATPase subunit beta [Octopus bimaculoides]|eukprot:XP_014777785.1 PREDICTED: sodium/potassium-transporting ATPase subunit beta-like [Octopus bimaculoides]